MTHAHCELRAVLCSASHCIDPSRCVRPGGEREAGLRENSGCKGGGGGRMMVLVSGMRET